MKAKSDESQSLWAATTEEEVEHPLKHDIQTEVCVVGAGIAGMSTAYMLTRQGRKVVVVDDGPVGGGETGYTTAHLSNAIDDRYFEIERLHGADGARLAAESHTAAIDRIQAIVEEEQIDCDFERLDGYLFTAPDQSPALLDRELEAAHRAGLKAVEKLPRAPLPDYDTGPCLLFPRQGTFHPLRYLKGLQNALLRDGGHLFTGTHVQRIDGGKTARIETRDGPVVTADVVVVATNTPINDLVAIHTKQAPYLTYVIAAPVPRGSLPWALWWDTLDPYHYVRLQGKAPRGHGNGTKGSDWLIVGGEDHKTGQGGHNEQRYARLEQWARERFPMMGDVAFHWSGQVQETIDGLAFIGRNPMDAANVFIATGDSGMGMTHGTIAGMLLTDLITRRENPWATLYNPSRKRLAALDDFLSENMNVVAQFGDWMTPGDVSSEKEIAAGDGAVVRHGLKKVAAYRDEQGELHEMSAVCPHLNCIVAWNGTEKTWDCPCHGSRFDARGDVILGPANSDLTPLHQLKEVSAKAQS